MLEGRGFRGRFLSGAAFRHCGCGEIGRRTRFRFWRRKAWGFKSLHPHHFPRPGQGPLNPLSLSVFRDYRVGTRASKAVSKLRDRSAHSHLISFADFYKYVSIMTTRRARFAILAAKRMVGLLLLLALFVSQSVMYAKATPDSGAHDQHQAHAAHQADCQVTASTLSGAAAEEVCSDHAAMAHCSVASCCFHCAAVWADAGFYGVPTAQNHRAKDENAVFSRPSSPQDRPPRLV